MRLGSSLYVFRPQIQTGLSVVNQSFAAASPANNTTTSLLTATLIHSLGNTALMTMVIDNQGRHYGGMSYDHMYPNMQTSPQFSDPWSHQTSTSNSSFPALSKTDSSRSTMSIPYSHMPPVSGSLAQGSSYSSTGYSGTDLLSYPQDIPRSTFGEQAYSPPSASSSSYAPSYSSLNYAQSLHQQQQQQQQRKLSET